MFMSTHDAIVQARLDDLQDRFAAALDLESATLAARNLDARRKVAPSKVARSSLRVRLGRRLAAFGATIAGEDECTKAHHAA
jgi:hypothetical protein